MKRQIISLLTAVCTVLSIGAAAAAAPVQQEQTQIHEYTVQVGEYECYVENDQYFTEIDGETYQVINVDDFVSAKDYSFLSSMDSDSWQNKDEISIVDSPYSGTLNISKGDDSTPIFVGRSSGNAKGFQIHCGFVFKNTYSVTAHLYNSIYDRWDENDITLTFSAASGQDKVLFVGTMVKYYTKACVTFHKSGSTGETTIGYTMSEWK